MHLNLIWIGRRFWNKLDIVDIVQDIQPQHLFWKRRRLNPLVYIESDTLFKLTYCFSKPNVKKIAEGLSPHLELSNSNRGDLAFTLSKLYVVGYRFWVVYIFSAQLTPVVAQASHQRIKLVHVCDYYTGLQERKQNFFYFTKWIQISKIATVVY